MEDWASRQVGETLVPTDVTIMGGAVGTVVLAARSFLCLGNILL